MCRMMRSERGIGIYEAAIWLVILLPVALVAVSLVSIVHDLNHISGVPAAVLRETPASGLRWYPDGTGGRLEADLEGLRVHVTRVSQRAIAEAELGLFQADLVSAKACFWIFSVNPSNGKLESPISSECDARGPLGNALSLNSELAYERERARGISVGTNGEFADKVVVTGVAVGAEARHVLDPRVAYHLAKGAIAFARQEVVL